MPIIANEPKHVSDVIRFEEPRYSREQIVIAANSGDLNIGAVLGMVAATKKHVPVDPAAGDGSEVAVAVLQHVASNSTADQYKVANVRFTTVVEAELEFSDSVTTEQKATAVAELKAAGIIAR